MPVSKKRPKQSTPSQDSQASSAEDEGGSSLWIMVAVAAVVGVVGWQIFGGSKPEAVTVTVTVPKLSAKAAQGRSQFNAICAECHGIDAAGGADGEGPPLIHRYYEPGHHSNQAFRMAIFKGVKQHHWHFGNMAPLPKVTGDQISNIIAFVRATQKASGVF